MSSTLALSVVLFLMLHVVSEFNAILNRYEQGKPFFLYTGRGPSSDNLHLGHLIPFMFTRFVFPPIQPTVAPHRRRW